MKETIKLIFVLTLICLISGVLLAFVNNLTEAPIMRAAKKEKMRAIKTVLPEYDNDPYTDTLHTNKWSFYIARKNGIFNGASFEATTSKGYGGDITIMAGINTNHEIQAIEILKQTETPGLGARISTKKFKDKFAGRNIDNTKWSVTKDQGDIDEITAATISSRAVLSAIKEGLDSYIKYENKIKLRKNK